MYKNGSEKAPSSLSYAIPFDFIKSDLATISLYELNSEFRNENLRIQRARQKVKKQSENYIYCCR